MYRAGYCNSDKSRHLLLACVGRLFSVPMAVTRRFIAVLEAPVRLTDGLANPEFYYFCMAS